ncbi:ABC transporter substrate-binding protein [Brucellaceae bacterium C25G]
MSGVLICGTAFAAFAQDLDNLSPQELLPLAQKEGKVTIFSLSSRMNSVEAAFEDAYPGIDVQTVDMNSNKQIARVTAEQQAKAHSVDVLYLADTSVVKRDLLDKNYVQGYIPPRLIAELPDQFKKPLLVHRLTARALMYNESAYPDGSPVSNLWELTTPQWRGKVVTIDPTLSGVPLDMFVTIALHPDEMAAAYEKQFGKPIEVDEDLSGAGEQFIRDLYANDLILVSDDETLYGAVGTVGKKDAPVGFINYSARRNNKKNGLALQIANEVEPASGFMFPSVLAVVNNAPNPAAARLLIDFLMGDETPSGGAGFQPFNVPGDYSPRPSIKSDEDAIPLDELNLWMFDAEKVSGVRSKISDLILSLQ